MTTFNPNMLSNIPANPREKSPRQAYDEVASFACPYCLRNAQEFFMDPTTGNGDIDFCFDCLRKIKKFVMPSADPKERSHWALSGHLNPLRSNPRGLGNQGTQVNQSITKEDVMFSGVRYRGNKAKKIIPCLIETRDDGTVELTMPIGVAPDTAGFNRNRAFQIERRVKAKKRCQDKLGRVVAKTERKQETVADYTARWKATAELLGEEEAARLQDAEFWEDGGYDLVPDDMD